MPVEYLREWLEAPPHPEHRIEIVDGEFDQGHEQFPEEMKKMRVICFILRNIFPPSTIIVF
jgi:hypothetical protein